MLAGSTPLNPQVRGGHRLPELPPGTPPQAPNAFGLNPPSQLVVGYLWLAFLDQVRKEGSRIKSSRQNPPDQNPFEKKKMLASFFCSYVVSVCSSLRSR